jgi:CSLREA domain-containing protein
MTSNNTAGQTNAVISRKARIALCAVVMLSPVLFFAVQASRKAGATADRQIRSRSLAVARNATAQRDDQITQSPEATVQIFGNNAPITINDATPATPYPSTIAVSNVTPATVTRVSVILNGLTHTNPDDVNVLLVGPGGQRTVLIADAGGADNVSGLMLTFSPTATATLPDETTLTTGTYRPANYGTLNDDFPAPGPGTLNNESPDLSVFNLTNPNGDWRLFVTDDRTGDTGQIANGWLLLLTVPTVFTVNSTADPGNGVCDATECTLREAINAAIAATGNSDLINFSALFNTPQTINLLTALPDISQSMTIQGPGANLLTVRRDTAATDFRIFTIAGGIPQVDIRGMTITGGRVTAGAGGGISSQSNLLLTNVVVTGNQATNGGGGGVDLRVADGVFSGSTFSGNTSMFGGGGIVYQGNDGRTLRLVSSTLSGNNSGNDIGGGILNFSTSGNSRLEVVSSTIANNTAGNGGGIFTFTQSNPTSTATTTLRNTIIANNSPNNLATGTNGGGAATFITNGFNLSDNFTGGGFTPLATDITAQPRLGPLSLGGGTTLTHALLGGSPALNAGDASGQATDQRGQSRPATGADIGAVEMQTILVTNNSDAGAGSLRQAIATATSNGAGLDDILFDNTVFNTQRTITLTTGHLPSAPI